MNDILLAKLLYWLNIIFVVLLGMNILFMIANEKLLSDCKKLMKECKELMGFKEMSWVCPVCGSEDVGDVQPICECGMLMDQKGEEHENCDQ